MNWKNLHRDTESLKIQRWRKIYLSYKHKFLKVGYRYLNISQNRHKVKSMISILDFPGGSEVKASAWNVGDLCSIPVSGRSPGEGNGNPLQHSCLENPMEGGAQQATVHGVTKSQTGLSDFTHSLTQ